MVCVKFLDFKTTEIVTCVFFAAGLYAKGRLTLEGRILDTLILL